MQLTFYINIFFPGLGILLMLLKFEDVEDYVGGEREKFQNYIRFRSVLINDTTLDEISEINRLNTFDYTRIGDSESKKRAIIDNTITNLPLKIAFLKKCLLDSDREVVHYASSKVIEIEESLKRRIIYLEGLYESTHSEMVLKRLIILYDRYIYSGLISKELLQFTFKRQYRLLILLEQNIIVRIDKFYMRIALVLIALEKYQEAQSYIRKILKIAPLSKKALLSLMQIHYALKNYDQVKAIARNLNEKYPLLKQNEKEIVMMWISKEAR